VRTTTVDTLLAACRAAEYCDDCVCVSLIFLAPVIDLNSRYSFAFTALTLLVGWQEGHPACKKSEWWGAGVVICLQQGADLHMAQLMSLASVKSRLVLPF